MTTYEGVTILAILLGPIIAVQVTRYLDDKKEKKQRKLEVFKTLMGTRARILSLEHVGALNRIGVDGWDETNVGRLGNLIFLDHIMNGELDAKSLKRRWAR